MATWTWNNLVWSCKRCLQRSLSGPVEGRNCKLEAEPEVYPKSSDFEDQSSSLGLPLTVLQESMDL